MIRLDSLCQRRCAYVAPDARALLVAFADTVEGEQRAGGSLAHVTGYASKSAEQAARIAAVLTLWQDLHAPLVALQAMGWGIALAQFYLSEAVGAVRQMRTSLRYPCPTC